MTKCKNCGGEAENYLCFSCVRRLRDLLIECRDLVDELEVQITRQSVGTKSVGGSTSAEDPLVFDEAASKVLDQFLERLSNWALGEKVAWVSLSRGGKAVFALDHLIANVFELSKQEGGYLAFGEFSYLKFKALSAIDRKEPKIPLGTCECGRMIHGKPGRSSAPCPCGAVYNVRASRLKLQLLGRDQLVTATQAVALGEIEGRRLNKNTIRSWAKRGKLESHGTDDGENLYRFGDLLDLTATAAS